VTRRLIAIRRRRNRQDRRTFYQGVSQRHGPRGVAHRSTVDFDSGLITLALVLSLFRRRSMKRRPTMKRSLLGVVLLLTLNGSGFAQTAKTGPAFYVVLNSLTRSCTVVDKVPRTDTPNITVATDTIYKTRAEAEAAAKTLTPCSQ
jgi:hypothetical protein